jgi:hypothetical protein
VYGNAEQLTHGVNGLLFDMNSATALTEQLHVIIANRAILEQMQRNISPPASFKTVHKQYMQLYAG